MEPTSSHHMSLMNCRKILQAADLGTFDSIPEPTLSPTTTANHTTNTSSSASASVIKRPFNPNTPLDSSMALTILVLLTALFFLGFFSVYIRRLSASGAAAHHPSPPSSANHKGGGLDGATVRSLPVVAYGKAAKHRMIIEDCPICLTEFLERESVKLIPYCGHVFHPNCIDTWLASHVTCPLCRSAQLFKQVEEHCLDVNVMDDKNLIGTSEISTVHGIDTWRGRNERDDTHSG